jgi:hypothetical protein
MKGKIESKNALDFFACSSHLLPEEVIITLLQPERIFASAVVHI